MASKRLKTKKLGDLSFDLIDDILTRLTVKTLTRFRCVCKRWGSLVQSKEFIRKQTTRARRKFLCVNNKRFCSVIYECESHDKPKMTIEELDLMGKDNVKDIEVIGHCNGLLCLKYWNSKRLVVWNPSLKELRKMRTRRPIDDLDALGFGYDRSIDDYKVVVLSANVSQRNIHDNSSVGQILMLKSTSRTISFSADYNIDERKGTLLGGNLFWIAYMIARNEDIIVCFDLVSETFEELPLPPKDWGYFDPVYRKLQVLRGRLCVVDTHNFLGEEKIVVWGNDESKPWNKLLAFSITNPLVPTEYGRRTRLLSCYADDGELFMRVMQGYGKTMDILVYDVNKNMFKEVEIGFSSLGTPAYFYGPFEYVETLVPTSSRLIANSHGQEMN